MASAGATNSNSFGGTREKGKASTPPPGPTTTNPFGAINLSSAAKPANSLGSAGFSFGANNGLKADPPAFNFGKSSNHATKSGTAKAPSSAVTKERLDRLREAGIAKLRQVDEMGGRTDLLRDIQCFLAYRAAIVKPVQTVTPPPVSAAATATAPSVASPPVAPAPKPFGNFARPADTSATKKSTFAFGPAATAPAPSVAAPAPVGGDNDSGFPTEPSKEAERNSDPEYNTLYDVNKVKFYAMEGEKWKGFATGPLRIDQHVSLGSRRMVLRDSQSGKVHLNLSISKGMTFKKIEKGSGVKLRKYISFMGIRNEKVGSEMFMFSTSLEDHTNLLAKLCELAA